MFMLRKFIFALFFILVGCNSDYKLSLYTEKPAPGIEAPEIEVDPLYHNYGALSAGSETQDITITIENLGNGDLYLSDVYLHSGSSNFTLTSIPVNLIGPHMGAELIVAYAPGTYEVNNDTISIFSNDEDEPEVQILLDGSGDAPVITVSPAYHDFGTVYLGCDDTVPITVGNIGNSNLIISDIEYFASVPVDFSLEPYEDAWGSLPITIEPGNSIDLEVGYLPLDDLDDAAYVEIASNDPEDPIITSDHDGLGDYERWIIDGFVQDGNVSVDILFVIDNSGSMGSNQTNLKNNFDDFIAVFGAAGVDFHIALITTDDAGFVGDVITAADADPVTEFNNQVDLIGYHGSAYEKGLWYAYQAANVGGDAAPGSATGFFRESARFVVVYVSDEPDFSHSTAGGGGSATMDPADYSAHLLSLKSSSDLVVAHAVAGDYPGGCSTNGGAQFGDGYYDVVTVLGGTFMSICASDWSVTMDTLATDSMATMSFLLSGNPIEDTISVAIDGAISSDWTYDSSVNSITFSVAPPDGGNIEVLYAVWAECN